MEDVARIEGHEACIRGTEGADSAGRAQQVRQKSHFEGGLPQERGRMLATNERGHGAPTIRGEMSIVRP